MKVIFHIAKAELQLLFFSPIAWLLLLCFSLQSGLIYTGNFERLVVWLCGQGSVNNVSSELFTSSGTSLWAQMSRYFYFYIPLLTMGCMSRDLSSGSIRLLYSSPISNLQIVLGKYLALVYYALILMGVLALYVVIAWCTTSNFEAGWIWTGWLGLLLLACAYMAIGLFMSSLTSYQIISAVGTFVVFMLLSVVKGVGQQYDIVRDITYWLGMDGRIFTFVGGMLCSEDVIYFLTIIGLFLSLTVIRLYAIRQKQRFMVTFGKNMCVVAVVCVLAYASSRPTLSIWIDTTRGQQNSLTRESQDIMENLEGDMTITAYVNVLDPNYRRYSYPGFILENQRCFQQYIRFKPEMQVRTVYYYAEPNPDSLLADPTGKRAWAKAKLVCETQGADSTILKNKEEVDRLVDLSGEGYTFIRQIERENGQKAWLRVYDKGLPGETEIAVAFKRMAMPLPKIGYVEGHGERDYRERGPYGYYDAMGNKKCKFSVWNQGFDMETVSLDETIAGDIDVLMLADPQGALTGKEEEVLREYVDRGGNIFILGEPRSRETLNPTLRRLFGVELTPLLAQHDSLYSQLRGNTIVGRLTQDGKEKFEDIRRYYLIMPTCAGVEQVDELGFTTFSVVENTPTSPCWTELETTDFVNDSIRFNPEAGEISKQFTTVMGLYRKVGDKEQRIIISGDADALTNNEYYVYRSMVTATNEAFMLGGASWLSYGKVPLKLERPQRIDNNIYMGLGGITVLKWFFRGILPLIILVLYACLWLRRRGR